MDKLGANFRGIEGKMQSLLKKDEKETNSETSSLKFENNKRNDQIVQVNNQQHSAPSENMNQNYDLEEEYRNLRPQRYLFTRSKNINNSFFSSRGSRGERKKSRDRTRESREARLPGSITGSEVKSDVHEPHVSMLV